MTTQLEETLARLEALGNEGFRAQNTKRGVLGRQFGVPMGDIRKLADKIKTDHPLAVALWETQILEAQLLAILVLQLKELSADDLDRMVRSIPSVQVGKWFPSAQVADWFSSYVIRKHPEKESLRQRWMSESHPWAARAGWDLTSQRIGKEPEGLDLPALLDRIEAEMPTAAPEVQWTMNMALATIGIHFPDHRERAIAIGEKLGLYRAYPVAKGCTSPFAPIWIGEMVRRKA
jgi:3-methyladenine DNA glycosylase AlkD